MDLSKARSGDKLWKDSMPLDLRISVFCYQPEQADWESILRLLIQLLSLIVTGTHKMIFKRRLGLIESDKLIK